MESPQRPLPQSNTKDDAWDCNYREQMLETIINNLEVGVYVSDYYTGEILYSNPKTAEFFQNRIHNENLIGLICWEACGFTERCDFCPYKHLIDENGNALEPYSWEHHFAEYGFWAKIINQVIKWVDGRLAQITVFYDVTETKKMEALIAKHIRYEEQWKMQHNLQILLDSLPLPIRIVDIETSCITYVNKKFLDMFEYDAPENVIGHHVLMLVPPISSDGFNSQQRINEFIHLKGISNAEFEYLTSSGKRFFALLTNCTIDYDGRESSVGIITDLTTEKEQRRLLMQAAQREREANQLKSNFLSNMSHEIRTPMNAIIGLTEIELRKKANLDVYKKINKSAKNLLQIINDILDLSKIEANKIELFHVEFDLEDVLSSVLMVVSPRLAGKPVDFLLDLSLDLPRHMIGDKTRLWQVIRNLLDNAAKFTSEGSITLTIFEDKDRSTEKDISLTFIVADTGSGMSEEQACKIFLPYEQIHEDRGLRHGGSGLGLPIAKQLCELMGGSMNVESKPDYGTTMRLTLPFARSKNAKVSSHKLGIQHLSGIKVLLVDDSDLCLKAMVKLLESCGAQCFAVQNAEDALKTIHAHSDKAPFDVIVLDHSIEELSGLECAKYIRQNLPPESKILVLTSYGNHLDKEDMILCGVDKVIEKPFVPTHFIRKITDISRKNLNSGDVHPKLQIMFDNTSILVCEDNEINQEIIVSMLELLGIKAILASNGRLGIELLEKGEPVDLVFMDLHMPIMDGYKASKAIRSNHKYDNLPIISLTADAMVETFNECLSIGMNDVITKPAIFEDLQQILIKWLPESKRRLC